jgi:hypothetical protein
MKVPSFPASFQKVLAVTATTLSFIAILAQIPAIFLTAAAELCTLLTGTAFFLQGAFFPCHLSLAGWL